eukprot:2855434-Ditylum_brightwellii.AAC.1
MEKNSTVNGESVLNNDIAKIVKKESSKNSELRKRRKSRAMKIQRTVDQSSDATLKDVCLSMKSDDKSSAPDSSSSSWMGYNKGQKMKMKKKNGCNVKTNK